MRAANTKNYIVLYFDMSTHGGRVGNEVFSVGNIFFFYQIGFVKHHFYGPAVSLQIKHV